MPAAAASDARIFDALDQFQEAREGARRFHGDIIGKSVDPEHCFADFLVLAKNRDKATIEKKYWAKVEKSTLVEVSGIAGGYTVPPEFSTSMMRDISTGSLLRKLGAYVHPMKTRQLTLPVPDVSTAPTAAGIAPYFGGFQMQWGADNSVFPSTAGMLFRDVVLTAWNLEGYVYASNPFMDDSLGIEVWLTRLFSRGAAWYQDYAFLQGLGVGQPQGIIGCGGASTVTRGGAGTIGAADVQSMVDNLLPSAWEDGAYWLIHPSALTKLTAITGWFPNGPLMLNGLPIIPTGKCSTLGTRGDLILVCPSLYIIGDRMQFEIAISREEPTAYKANQSAIRVFSRLDGQPMISTPITLSDTTSKVSPYVVLV